MKSHDIEISSNNTVIHYEEPIEIAAKANEIKQFNTHYKLKEDSECPTLQDEEKS